MRMLCYGDSNTYGYDPRGFVGDRYQKESRWVDILAQKLRGQLPHLHQARALLGRAVQKREISSVYPTNHSYGKQYQEGQIQSEYGKVHQR